MKFLKKTLSVVLVLAMSLSLLPPPTAVLASDVFADVGGHWAQSSIEELAAKGIINGMGDGTFQPEGTVTREQFMKLVVAVRGTEDGAQTDLFYDIPEGYWANAYIAEGLNRGLFSLSETDGAYFAPEAPMDRDTVALWITRAVGVGGSSDSTEFADNGSIENRAAVSTAVAEGLSQGSEDHTCRPNHTLTRAASAVLVERLMAKDAELYGERPNKNEIEFADGVRNIEPAAGVNTLKSFDEASNKYVFENIDDSLRSLAVGEVFVIYPCDSVPDGCSIKVADIEISGDTATITQAGVTLDEIAATIDIQQTQGIDITNIDESKLPEGVTVTNERGQTIAQAKAEKEALKNGVLLADSDHYEQSVGVGEIHFNFGKVKLGGLSAEGGFTLKSPKVLVDIEKNWLGAPTKAKAVIVFDYSFDADFKAKAKFDKDITLIPFYFPVGPTGITIGGDLSLDFGVDGTVALKIKNSSEFTCGLKYDNGLSYIKSVTKKSSSIDVDAEVEAKLGLKINLGVKWLNGAVNAQIYAEGGLGASVEADLIAAKTSVTEIHICNPCLDGDLYFYLTLGASFELGYGFYKASAEWKILDKESGTFAGFYISKVDGREPMLEFGWGECPYVYKQPKFLEQPSGTTAIKEGENVSFAVKAKNESEAVKKYHLGDDAGLKYQWYKNGTPMDGETGSSVKFIVDPSDAGQYYCVVSLAEYPELNVQSDTVTLTVTAPDLPQVEADFAPSDPSPVTPIDDGGDFDTVRPEFAPSDPAPATPIDGGNGGFDVILPDF
jgi:hypothetical protein